VTKEHILAEIRRTAVENNGRPLGAQRLASETGIRYADWHGKYWARWSDALREAGYAPNKLNAPLPEVKLLSRLADLAQELGHFPVAGELRLKARSDPSFPSHNTFARFGPKRAMAARLREFCLSEGRVDVAALCMPATEATREVADHAGMPPGADMGCVYLMKSGKFYKIGRSNAVGRREREIALQLPERVQLVHSIRTDDPAGIEGYWHRRFQDRRKNGEWFQLTPDDVAAFRRRKFM